MEKGAGGVETGHQSPTDTPHEDGLLHMVWQRPQLPNEDPKTRDFSHLCGQIANYWGGRAIP